MKTYNYPNSTEGYKHVVAAERALGRKMRPNEVVHHVNEDETDFRNENLVICTRPYHALIHQRMRAYEACGHYDWRKCNYCKKYDDPKNLCIGGTGARHNACRNEFRRVYYAKHPEKIKKYRENYMRDKLPKDKS